MQRVSSRLKGLSSRPIGRRVGSDKWPAAFRLYSLNERKRSDASAGDNQDIGFRGIRCDAQD